MCRYIQDTVREDLQHIKCDYMAPRVMVEGLGAQVFFFLGRAGEGKGHEVE